MKLLRRQTPLVTFVALVMGWALALGATALPVLAAEEGAADPVESPVGAIFKWVNFLLVAGGLAFVINKFGKPYFRGRAQAIAQGIREAAEEHAAAERAVSEATQQLNQVQAEIQELRSAGVREATAEAERIRTLAKLETEKIGKAALGEIDASERAGRQELRAIAARLATERAAALVKQRMNAPAQAGLFRSFVSELQRSAS